MSIAADDSDGYVLNQERQVVNILSRERSELYYIVLNINILP